MTACSSREIVKWRYSRMIAFIYWGTTPQAPRIMNNRTSIRRVRANQENRRKQQAASNKQAELWYWATWTKSWCTSTSKTSIAAAQYTNGKSIRLSNLRISSLAYKYQQQTQTTIIRRLSRWRRQSKNKIYDSGKLGSRTIGSAKAFSSLRLFSSSMQSRRGSRSVLWPNNRK